MQNEGSFLTKLALVIFVIYLVVNRFVIDIPDVIALPVIFAALGFYVVGLLKKYGKL